MAVALGYLTGMNVGIALIVTIALVIVVVCILIVAFSQDNSHTNQAPAASSTDHSTPTPVVTISASVTTQSDNEQEHTDEITRSYFNSALAVASQMETFFRHLERDPIVMRKVDHVVPDSLTDSTQKLQSLFFADLIKCHNELLCNPTMLQNKEGLALVLTQMLIFQKNMRVGYNALKMPTFINAIDRIGDMNETIEELIPDFSPTDFFYIGQVLSDCGSDDDRVKYFSLLYKLFSVVAKADGTIDDYESNFLESLMGYGTVSSHYNINDYMMGKDSHYDDELDKLDEFDDFSDENDISDIEDELNDVSDVMKDMEETGNKGNLDPINELHSLIGLAEVKNEVTSLRNFVMIQQERRKKGLKAVDVSYHCVFTGNPGTGKTTVARILAQIYRDMGVLKIGHLVETDRSGLVAEYVGQTAVKTNKKIDEAIGGVLFIDEAYSLVPKESNNDYGQEAVATLLKRMEDERDNLIVILAGYSDNMKDFINSNPGLQSRFNRYIDFPDYSADDLLKIYCRLVENNQYRLGEGTGERLSEVITRAVDTKDSNFGNGRYVRNLFEKTLHRQASRLAVLPTTTIDDLCLLLPDDVPAD